MSELDIRQQVLESVGYGVMSTPSASTALAILRKGHVDLVLMEQGQFGAGSQTLSETIKRLKPALPVILYSADWEESHADMRFADFFLTKWASVHELLADIEEHLRRCRPFALGAKTKHLPSRT